VRRAEGQIAFLAHDRRRTGSAASLNPDIASSEGLFRAGILSLCVVVVLDVLIAAELYRLMRPVNEALARVMATSPPPKGRDRCRTPTS
jgi:hypothetical protein